MHTHTHEHTYANRFLRLTVIFVSRWVTEVVAFPLGEQSACSATCIPRLLAPASGTNIEPRWWAASLQTHNQTILDTTEELRYVHGRVCVGRVWLRAADLPSLRPLFPGRLTAVFHGREWNWCHHPPEGNFNMKNYTDWSYCLVLNYKEWYHLANKHDTSLKEMLSWPFGTMDKSSSIRHVYHFTYVAWSDLGAWFNRPLSLCTGLVYWLGGEAAGVQQVGSASLQAQFGSRRLVRPLQGATEPGQLPCPEVIRSHKWPDFLKGKPPKSTVMYHLKTWWCAVELFQRWGWTSSDPWSPNEARECRLPGSSLHSCYDKMVEGHVEVERVEDRGRERGWERTRERGSLPEV